VNQIILAGTGHRPDKLGGYNQAVWDRVYKLAYDELKRIRPDVVISGMALGWDQCLAQAAIDHKIPMHAYVPFEGQEKAWLRESQTRYWALRRAATQVKIVCEGDYASWKMGKRNQAMVNDCTHVLALWNGSSGGTANCVYYAKSQRRPIHNCWDKYVGNVLANQREINFR
jgi:uncharacterized phage-like protein YoqJ